VNTKIRLNSASFYKTLQYMRHFLYNKGITISVVTQGLLLLEALI